MSLILLKLGTGRDQARTKIEVGPHLITSGIQLTTATENTGIAIAMGCGHISKQIKINASRAVAESN